jgi:hypothetical protein
MSWLRLLVGANFSRFNGVCAFSGRRHYRRQRVACGDFVNLEDLPAQSSKMLLGGRVCVRVFIEMSVRALLVFPMYCVIQIYIYVCVRARTHTN